MKNVFKSFLLIAASAMMAVGCNKEVINDIPSEQGYTYYFRISNNETKTTIGTNSIAWEVNDQVGVFADGTINKFAKISTVSPSVEFPLFLSQALNAGDNIYCYYPYSEDLNNTSSSTAVKMSIPTVQEFESTGAYDADAMPMVSLPYVTSIDMAQGKSSVDDLYFMMLGGIFQFNIYGADFTSETIQSIAFQADQAIAGDFTFDLTSVDAEDASSLEIEDYEETTVCTTLSAAVGADKANAVTAYMVVAPGSYTGKIIVKTDAADYTFNIPAASAKIIERGHVKPINVNLANAERVLPEPVIVDGLYLITNADEDKAAGCYSTGNNLKAKSITIDASGNVSSEDVDVYDLAMTFTLVTTGEYAGMYTIADKNGSYLYAAGGSSSNYLKAKSTLDDDASYWSISEDADGNYNIIASKYTGSRNIIRYNGGDSSNLLFSCYESGKQSPVKIVPFISSAAPKPVISAIPAPAEVSKDGDVVTVNYSVTNAVSGKTISASSSKTWVNTFDYSIDGEISFAVDANTGAARTCTVTVHYEGATDVTFEVRQAAGVESEDATNSTLASWTFTSVSYPANKTNFNNNGSNDTASGTFYLNGSGSTWNSTKGYAFTAVTDITITITAAKTLKKGATISFSMDTYYNKASNAPVKGYTVKAAEGSATASITGLSATSISLSTSSATKTVIYTLQNDVKAGGTVKVVYTQTGKEGAGQAYIDNVKAEYKVN